MKQSLRIDKLRLAFDIAEALHAMIDEIFYYEEKNKRKLF